jgi:peroxiredoxin Q/BCP
MTSRSIVRRSLPFLVILAVFCIFLWYVGIFPGMAAMNALAVGSRVPPFVLKDQDGQAFDIASVVGKKNLVVYFYPKDDTPGCTREACSFRDQYERFAEADALVIGISADDAESHKAFADKYRLRHTLLSDPENEVHKMFGVFPGVMGWLAGRVTFVVNKEGRVVHTFNSHFQADRHIDESLQALKGMDSGR